MKRRSTACLAIIAAAAFSFGTANVAFADQYDDANLYDSATCTNPDTSAFKMSFYYNTNWKGAWRNVGYAVYDLDHLSPGGDIPNSYPLTFCNSGAGAGQHVKNNAAAGQNNHSTYTARIYYHSGYKGPQDSLTPHSGEGQFINVYNENASFQWTS